jgi:hypothetical protein
MRLPEDRDQEGVAWQRGIWDRYPDIYRWEVDQRFVPVVEQVLRRATLVPGEHVRSGRLRSSPRMGTWWRWISVPPCSWSRSTRPRPWA